MSLGYHVSLSSTGVPLILLWEMDTVGQGVNPSQVSVLAEEGDPFSIRSRVALESIEGTCECQKWWPLRTSRVSMIRIDSLDELQLCRHDGGMGVWHLPRLRQGTGDTGCLDDTIRYNRCPGVTSHKTWQLTHWCNRRVGTRNDDDFVLTNPRVVRIRLDEMWAEVPRFDGASTR